MKISEIEDLYKVLSVTVLFDNEEDYLNFSFDIYFDIQKTLEDKVIVNIVNINWIDYEPDYLLLKSMPIMEAISIIEVMIDEDRYIGMKVMDMVVGYNKSGGTCNNYNSEVLSYGLDGAQIAQLRTMRDKLLEILSYGS